MCSMYLLEFYQFLGGLMHGWHNLNKNEQYCKRGSLTIYGRTRKTQSRYLKGTTSESNIVSILQTASESKYDFETCRMSLSHTQVHMWFVCAPVYINSVCEYSRMFLKCKKHHEKLQKEKLSFLKYHTSTFILQKVTGIIKKNKPFTWVLRTPKHRDCEAPNLIACILFIWLQSCSHACSHVHASQVLKENKESALTQLRGCAPLKAQQSYFSVLDTNVARNASFKIIVSQNKCQQTLGTACHLWHEFHLDFKILFLSPSFLSNICYKMKRPVLY